MDNKEKQIRIGKITFGVVMILTGIVIFLQTLTNLDVVKYVLMLWPLVLVILGIETLIYRNRENVKYDLLGAIFTLIIIGMVTVFSVINYGVNKLLYDTKVQDIVFNNMYESEANYSVKDKLNLINFKDNEKIKVVVNTVPSANETIIKVKINNELGSIEEKISSAKLDISDYIFFNQEKSEMNFLKGFDDLKNIDIVIITADPNNITIN